MEIVVSTSLQSPPPAPPPASQHVLAILPAVVIVDQELSMCQIPWAGNKLKLGERTYSIRLPEYPGRVPCARCGLCFRATGPTGHADEEPICDLCLLDCDQDLGLVLGLVSVMRTYASASFGLPENRWEALVEVGAFARVYERIAAARFGPAREFPVEQSI